MAKSKSKRFEDFNDPQRLGDGDSAIFNKDLSVKPGNFPELDDRNYPAKLKEKLTQAKDEADKKADGHPPVNRLTRTYQRGFHKYRTAAYIHDQDGGHKGDGHFTKWPNYGQQVLDDAYANGSIRDVDHEVLSDEAKWKQRVAFPKQDSPKPYSEKSERFLMTNICHHKMGMAKVRLAKRDWYSTMVVLTGQHLPYNWTAHHLIPHELLQLKTPGKNQGLEPDEYDVLVQAGYDVNNGHNGIVGPGKDEGVPYHRIPRHAGNHVAYTSYASGLIQDVVNILRELADEKPPNHEAMLANILQLLTNDEDALWLHVIALGKKSFPPDLQGGALVGEAQLTTQKGKKTFSKFAILN